MPEWSKGCDSSSHGRGRVGSNPTASTAICVFNSQRSSRQPLSSPTQTAPGNLSSGDEVTRHQEVVTKSEEALRDAREPAWRLLHSAALLQVHRARTRLQMAYHAQPRYVARRATPKDILRAGASVFYLSVSGRPGPSEVAGGREKTKKQKTEGGPGPGMKNQKIPPWPLGPPWG